MVTRVGVIGFSEGNGHPFSFSAIINGYDDAAFAEAGWPVVHNYLRLQPGDRFGFPDVRVTHAWGPDRDALRRLCAACRIETACDGARDMLGGVDAVLIARDDWQSHWPLAQPFLAAGCRVFIDKPLTLDEGELTRCEPFLRSGQLLSCAALRHATELDPLRQPVEAWEIGRPRLVVATVLNELERYGIHMIEAIAGLGAGFERPVAVTRLAAPHEAFQIEFANGVPLLLSCLGAVGKTFHVSVFGERSHRHFDLHDNFGAFRRTLGRFFAHMRGQEDAWNPEETLRIMRLIQAGRRLRPGETAQLQ